MTFLIRQLTRVVMLLLALPVQVVRILSGSIIFNPKLGPLRYVATAGIAYVAFALLLVYVVAPLRGVIGHQTIGRQLTYAAERWLATAVYDSSGAFVGTFDPRLDSLRDVNYTESAIELGSYTANPDHKSIPVRVVPDSYWQCLSYHEDRYLGGWLNPYGIDLYGVLKIPYTSIIRTIQTRRPVLGVGGSTLPMQFARVVFNTPPSASEGSVPKLKRKLREWWMAPVIYHELSMGGDLTPLKQWAANHIWLAQRTGGQPLHGVEVTSRIVFGKEAGELTTAEQFVLASAVNKPIILLEGTDQLNAVRMDRWRYITEVRARVCAERLIKDADEQKKVLFELVQMAGGPPDPRVKPRLQQALEQYAPSVAKRAVANPIIRANALLPAARFGIREEMKQAYGFAWRDSVRGVTTTLDAAENLAFHERIKLELATLNTREQARINSGYTLDPAKAAPDRKLPNIVVVAANAKGEIVRYFEAGESAAYFGSPRARDAATGFYDPLREARQIASTGKMIAAVAIANEHRDLAGTLYQDTAAAPGSLETCEKGTNPAPLPRKAVVAFACSLNKPLEWRAAQLGQDRVKKLIDGFGFTLPPTDANGEATPPSTAVVRGLIAGAPRRVHHMAAVILGALLERGNVPVRAPSLVRAFDYTSAEAQVMSADGDAAITPSKLIRGDSHGLLKTLLSAPLCYRHAGAAMGTLKLLAPWCAEGRADLKLHFAKTGTSVTTDADATVDTWTAGGIQFANGAAYSYVVMVGTGSVADTWARKMHAAQATTPLVAALLDDLKAHAKAHPQTALLPAPQQVADVVKPAAATVKRPVDDAWRGGLTSQR
jgi:penicillin-binding protein 1A